MLLPKFVFEILHCSQHHVEELLIPFIIQMKFTITGNKLLILPAAFKINLGQLGRCVLLRILGYCNTFIVFFGRLWGEGRMQRVKGSHWAKKLPPKKRSPEKMFVLGPGDGW